MNFSRIQNQLLCLRKHKELLDQYNIQPVFATADAELTVEEFDTIHITQFKEEYTNLARKIVYSLDHLYNKYTFDYVIKIDDDTLFNIDRFDLSILTHDYIGRFYDEFTKNEIIINLPAYNLHETVRLYPSAYSCDPFEFASGDFYILSKKAVQEVISNTEILEIFYSENVRVSEDQFVGYCLRAEHITKFDFKYETDITMQYVLQITSNITSIHPVCNSMFASLLNKAPEEQLQDLIDSSSLIRRKFLIEALKTNIKNVIFNFVNLKKSSGMG